MTTAIILAGGKGERFKKDKTTQIFCGKPLYEHSLRVFSEHPSITQIIIVNSKKNEKIIKKSRKKYPKIRAIVQGGETRFKSSIIGFKEAIKEEKNIILFHNAANPGVGRKEISEVIFFTKKYGAAGVGRKVTSTLRNVSGEIIPRKEIFEMETPQGIQVEVYKNGLKNIQEVPTDDLQIAGSAGIIPFIIPAEWKNRKITFPEDIKYLEHCFISKMDFRIGIGQDSHHFSKNGILKLGGVDIPEAKKLLGNSDGDAVLHAITNSISSAMGGGSLSLFSDRLCKQGKTDSREYVQHILKILKKKKGFLRNISISIEAGKPKLEHYSPNMRKTIAELCSVKRNQIGISITSGEKLTEIGNGKGIGVSVITSLFLPE
jgi:2-C-methyl-D-erythritol 2,4-cyclodiphosphate synthase/2-C-methyl-D-erythritol 4-phosphate cytidylyltransferase